ncbi:MAG: DUF2027 domain-containing protein [Muribaculaceae bacterium]|nr:DUF2027 domain-containing protein [Muribaculaceae bacterium]
MAVKVGDTVRFLNDIGGGRVVRIADGMAYVADDDGFETPVLLRECVAVGAAMNDAPAPVQAAKAVAVNAAPAPTQLPVVETATGNSLNLVLGFEACDIKALSRSNFETFFVNDSNYYVYISVSSRSNLDSDWTLRFDGLIEPNIQEFLFELPSEELAHFDRLSVQYMAFKRGKEFEMKAPGHVDLKVDATKFARLHCFRPNPYFDNPVIAFDVAVADHAPAPMAMPDAEALAAGMKQKKRDVAREKTAHHHIPAAQDADVTVVDLHASELLDTTAGLSPANILNLQIDKFSSVMDAMRNRIGHRIVFIHGKGEGVLRQALMKELNHRYKGHDVQDASFREYGYGATQVTIRCISTDRQHGKRR